MKFENAGTTVTDMPTAKSVLSSFILSAALLSGCDQQPAGKPEKWETISGIQSDGTRANVDIDTSSIDRTSDGVSATVTVRITADDVKPVTYLCPDAHSGQAWALIGDMQTGHFESVAHGTASEAVAKRICQPPN
ncbi:MAG: hypothetical protein ABSC92_18785 [Rhizomicrobium sp.]|jgi:hypothetical protein